MKINDVIKAKELLKDVIIDTPILDACGIKDNLYIKAENMQKTGSFKLRGAFYKIANLTNEQKANGIVAASAGNHAQGVAYACKVNNIKGTIVMPKSAPMLKVSATKSYGVNVILQGNTFNDAYTYASNLAMIENAEFIEPFDDLDVITGQGTIGLELIDKLEDNDTVVVPIGGGGLASGIAYVIKQYKPNVKVIGVQAKNAPSMYESLKKNEITETMVKTMADGIAVKKPGKLTYELCREYLDDIVLVADDEIAASILIILEKMKLVSEGAGAIAIAACIFNKIQYSNKCYAILSGGNIDVEYLAQIIELGLTKLKRKISLEFTIIDKPQNLKRIVDLLSDANVNIVTVDHHRNKKEILSKKCLVSTKIEINDTKQLDDLIESLKHEGFSITYKDETYIIEG